MTRSPIFMAIAIPAIICGASIVSPPAPQFIWNATVSTPTGLYSMQPTGVLSVGDIVAILPPEPLANYLATGGYLPRGLLLLKRTLALPGQTVCRAGLVISVDGITIGYARPRDRKGRSLPIWQGCRTLSSDEIFLMNWQVQDSLDGRYFGPLPTSSVIGRAIPLWTDEAGDGHFVWRADSQ